VRVEQTVRSFSEISDHRVKTISLVVNLHHSDGKLTIQWSKNLTLNSFLVAVSRGNLKARPLAR
jgi:hypothetical protein